MNDVTNPTPKRKILSIAKADRDPEPGAPEHLYVENDQAVYMVWRDGGDMPRRVYRASERDRAIGHAKTLAAQEGHRFYVLRAWRGYEPDVKE